MIIIIDAEKAFDKIQHHFMMKTPNKIVIPQPNKQNLQKCTANVTFNGGKTE